MSPPIVEDANRQSYVKSSEFYTDYPSIFDHMRFQVETLRVLFYGSTSIFKIKIKIKNFKSSKSSLTHDVEKNTTFHVFLAKFITINRHFFFHFRRQRIHYVLCLKHYNVYMSIYLIFILLSIFLKKIRRIQTRNHKLVCKTNKWTRWFFIFLFACPFGFIIS